MEPYFAQFGVSGSQWGVLRVLHRAEVDGAASLRLTDLCDRLLVRPPSVTGVVDRLQRQGLIARFKSADDHRVKEVRLTSAGRERVQRVLERLPAQHELILGDLTGAERQQLQHLLDVVSQRLQTLASARDEGDSNGGAQALLLARDET
jgi:DNA-binding MarR family transcriptional regulator